MIFRRKKTYRIYGHYNGSKFLGEVQARDKKEALSLAEDSQEIQDATYVSLCHQCAGEVDGVGDSCELEAWTDEENPST